MLRRLAGAVIWGGAVVVIAGPATAQSAALFTGISDLPGGNVFSEVLGISPDGSVVVGRSSSRRYNLGEAIYWSLATGIVGLGDLTGGLELSAAFGASEGGRVIVGEAFASDYGSAVCWINGQIVPLGDLGGDPPHCQATAVSSDGTVITGVAVSLQGTQAFRWTAKDGMIGLGDLPGGPFRSDGFAISADGSVIVGSSRSAEGTDAFRWTATEGMTRLNDLHGVTLSDSAYGVSGDGRTIVGTATDFYGRPGVRWKNQEVQAINRWPEWGWYADAYDASFHGDVIVGRAWLPATFQYQAVVWTPCAGMRSVESLLVLGGLNIGDWVLTEVTAISDDGLTIAGNGINPKGYQEGWVAMLPEFERLDVNWDGVVDARDALDFAAAVSAGFGPDFNHDGREDSQDYLDFLIEYFER